MADESKNTTTTTTRSMIRRTRKMLQLGVIREHDYMIGVVALLMHKHGGDLTKVKLNHRNKLLFGMAMSGKETCHALINRIDELEARLNDARDQIKRLKENAAQATRN
jgi:hypothetical protein